MGRAIAAFLAVALAFPASVILLDLHHALGGMLMVGAILFGCVLALGFPTLILFCKRQWWELWRFVLGGAAGGALCALPFVGGVTFAPVYLFVLFMIAGVAFAGVFWLSGIWRNDNLTCPKEFRLPGGVTYKFARNALRRRSG
jgi:hypothetical protein